MIPAGTVYHKTVIEWVEIDNEEEKIEAKTYLLLWKKFYLKHLPSFECVYEEFLDKRITVGDKAADTIGLRVFLKRIEDVES